MKSKSCRFLCWLLAGLMVVPLGPRLVAQEVQSPEEVRPNTTLLADPAIVPVPDIVDTPLDATYVLPQGCLVATVRPQAILASPICRMMPLEVIQAGSLQHSGIDALLMDRLIVSVEPPIGGPPNYALTASFTAPVAGKLHPQITAQLEKQEGGSRPHFKNPKPFEPSLFFPTDNVILATPEATLQRFIAGSLKPGDGELLQRLKNAEKDDLYVAVDFVPLRPLVNMALMQAPVPPQLQHFYTAPDLIKTVEMRLNISHAGVSELIVESNNADDAEKLEQLVIKSVDLVRAEAAKEAERLKTDADPVQQALGRYQERMMQEASTAFLPKREGEKLVVFRLEGIGGETDALTLTAVSGILVALLLPATQAAREAARRTTSINNLKYIMLAMFNYSDVMKSFPSHANYGSDGKPLLSWRVHILPYLELGGQEKGPGYYKALYDRFHLDEPWDSEHNKTLIAQMPEVYLDPSSRLQPTEGRTHYLGVKGPTSFFNGSEKGIEISQISDGASNTIAVVQVNDERAANWTKPDDWELDSQNVLKGLAGSMHPGTFVAGYADGSVRMISENMDPNTFEGLLTIAGGETAQP